MLERQRIFIARNYCPDKIFTDVTKLNNEDNLALDSLSENFLDVPGVDVSVAGSSCRRISRMCNQKKRSTQKSFRQGKDSSGSTFEGSFTYVIRKVVVIPIWENTTPIDSAGPDKNEINVTLLDTIGTRLQERQYLPAKAIINPIKFAQPLCRNRMFFWGLFFGRPIADTEVVDYEVHVNLILVRFLPDNNFRFDIDVYMLEDGDPYLAEVERQAIAVNGGSTDAAPDLNQVWVGDHQRLECELDQVAATKNDRVCEALFAPDAWRLSWRRSSRSS